MLCTPGGVLLSSSQVASVLSSLRWSLLLAERIYVGRFPSLFFSCDFPNPSSFDSLIVFDDFFGGNEDARGTVVLWKTKIYPLHTSCCVHFITLDPLPFPFCLANVLFSFDKSESSMDSMIHYVRLVREYSVSLLLLWEPSVSGRRGTRWIVRWFHY